MERDFTPLHPAVHNGDDAEDLLCSQRGAGNARFLKYFRDVEEPREIKAPSCAPEFADRGRQLLLRSNPRQVRGRRKSFYPVPAQIRNRISANKLSQCVEFEQAGTCIFQRVQHTFMVLQLPSGGAHRSRDETCWNLALVIATV